MQSLPLVTPCKLLSTRNKVFHQLADLGCVDLDLRPSLSCPTVQPFFPKSHLTKQNWADSETAKNKVNQTKVRELMEHPVSPMCIDALYVVLEGVSQSVRRPYCPANSPSYLHSLSGKSTTTTPLLTRIYRPFSRNSEHDVLRVRTALGSGNTRGFSNLGQESRSRKYTFSLTLLKYLSCDAI